MLQRGQGEGASGCPSNGVPQFSMMPSMCRTVAELCAGGAIRTLTLFFFILWHPLSDVWWLLTNRHRLHTNRRRLSDQPAIGYPPTTIGYTQTAIGYPPPAIGYPPAAIVGRIGHSEFFFFLITAPPDCASPSPCAGKVPVVRHAR